MTETNQLLSKCDEIICSHNLLEHPFYQAWSNGTLPVEALRDYAREYGAFIRTISKGWETLGKAEFAKHEMAHAKIWDRTFAASLNTQVEEPKTKEVANLVESARDLFSQVETAMTALYAFEAQQPLTAASKLKGLREHYAELPESCGEYFRLHSGDYDEVSILKEMINDLEDGERQIALNACEKMSRALYDALTGIYAPYQARCAKH